MMVDVNDLVCDDFTMTILRTREAAARLGLSPSAIQARAARGDIPGAFRTNGDTGHWRYDEASFDAYCDEIKSGRKPAPATSAVKVPSTRHFDEAHFAAARSRARALKKAGSKQ